METNFNNNDLEKMRECAWGWTLFAVALSIVTMCLDLVVWPMLAINVFTTLLWAAVLTEEDRQQEENRDLFQ